MDDERLLKKLNRRYKQTGGGGIPFSAFQKKISKKISKKKSVRKKKKISHSKKVA